MANFFYVLRLFLIALGLVTAGVGVAAIVNAVRLNKKKHTNQRGKT